MLHEYAVNPNSLSSFNEIWQALEQFGVAHGRLLVECPKRWWGLVRKELADAEQRLPPAEYKELEERCFRLKEDRILIRRRNLNFDGEQSCWLDGLLPEHRSRPFRAVLQLEVPQASEIPVLARFDFKDQNPLWKVDRTITVARTAEALTDAVLPLLKIGTDLLLIDPYFSGEYRHCSVFARMLAAALDSGARFDRVEVHTRTTAAGSLLSDRIRQRVMAKVPHCPAITVFKWQQIPGGERLHDRFILTDRGGIEIPGGTDVGEPGETTNVTLLDDSVYRCRWDQYQESSGAFDLASKIAVSSPYDKADPK